MGMDDKHVHCARVIGFHRIRPMMVVGDPLQNCISFRFLNSATDML
jgi:hypothetical protein